MFSLLLLISCLDKDVYQGDTGEDQKQVYVKYVYPYGKEVQNVVAEITLEMVGKIDEKKINVEFPF